MGNDERRQQFERLVLPYLDDAYNLAHWLMRSDAESQDAVQEAFLRAFRFFGSFHGEDGRAWLLGIVRNTCFTLLERNHRLTAGVEFDEASHSEEALAPGAVISLPLSPEAAAIAGATRELVERALRELPPEFREVLVLREIQGCSYKEIAAIAAVPMGTVMSRLARARRLMQRTLARRMQSGKDTGT